MPLWCESVKARAAATDLLDEGCQPEEGAPKGQKATKGGKAAAQKGAEAGKGCQTRPRQRSQHAARGEQGRENPGTDRPDQGSDPGRDYASDILAGPQRARLPLDRRQEPRPQDRVYEDRGWRSRLSDQEVGIPKRRSGTGRRPRGLAAFCS